MGFGSSSRQRSRAGVGSAIAVIAAAVATGVLTPGTGSSVAALAVLSSTAGADGNGVGSVLAWIVAGSAITAAVAYTAANAVGLGLPTQAAVGLGAAVGGGFGAVAYLLRAGEGSVDDDGEVTVSSGDDGGAPAVDDLFESHMDPVVYYSGEDGQLFVRAVNPAFEDRFGASATTLAETPLREALATEAAPEVADRLVDGEPVDRTATCETVDGAAAFRLRSVQLPGDRPQGYVQFTPAED